MSGGLEEEDPELNATLWVGNLDSKITENILYELFIQAGPIDKIHIPKGKDGTGHKGYCFITFQNMASVPYTMDLLEGTSLYGKMLRMQPRPGSKHRKVMDARENDQRHFASTPQLQVHPNMQGQAQWFMSPAPPQQQMAQFSNMLVYPNQMFQAFPAGLPNMNNGMQTVVQLPAGMGTQLMALPVQHQQQAQHSQATHVQAHAFQQPQELQHHQQQYRGPRHSGEFRVTRPPRPMTNGYTLHRHPNGNNAQLPSQYSQQSQVLNGSQTHSPRFQSSRGPRPHGGHPRPQHPHHQHHAGPRTNGNNLNGNTGTRMPFTPRNSSTFTQPTVYASPVYHQSPPLAGGPQLQYQPERQFYPRPQQPTAPFPVGNVYQF